jgi:hypothetical protein
MNRTQVRISTFLGVCAATALGTFGTAAENQSDQTEAANSQMSIGITQTETAAQTTLPIPMAVPRITGPAALPPEDQGLPGD